MTPEEKAYNDRRHEENVIRLDALEAGYKKLTHDVQANTDITRRIETNTKELVNILVNTKGVITVLGYLIPFSKFILAVGSLGVFLWYCLKGKPQIFN